MDDMKMIPLSTRTVKRLLEHGSARFTIVSRDQDPVVGVKCDDGCNAHFANLCLRKDCNKRYLLRSPFKSGERLLVSEDWRTFVSLEDVSDEDIWGDDQPRGAGVAYEAGGGMSISKGLPRSRSFGERDDMAAFGRLRPAANMPRWAVRMTITVLERRVHRLQAINETAMAGEGIVWSDKWHGFVIPDVEHPDPHFPVLSRVNMREMFAAFWDVEHGSGAWGMNPWAVSMLVSAEVEAAHG